MQRGHKMKISEYLKKKSALKTGNNAKAKGHLGSELNCKSNAILRIEKPNNAIPRGHLGTEILNSIEKGIFQLSVEKTTGTLNLNYQHPDNIFHLSMQITQRNVNDMRETKKLILMVNDIADIIERGYGTTD